MAASASGAEIALGKHSTLGSLLQSQNGGKFFLDFNILNFGKFQVSKWASGMKRLFKVRTEKSVFF